RNAGAIEYRGHPIEMPRLHQEGVGHDKRFGEFEAPQHIRKLGEGAAANMHQARDRDHRSHLAYPGLRITKRRMPPSCSLASSSSQPVVAQKCSKSFTAPGSVASTSSTAPAASGFRARRAFSTGSGHNRPVASSVASTLKSLDCVIFLIPNDSDVHNLAI